VVQRPKPRMATGAFGAEHRNNSCHDSSKRRKDVKT
jgi:hypothetical protein